MCGLFAIISIDGSPLPGDAETRVGRALDAIRHRGPDAFGIHMDPGRRFALGHVRLSVIDTSSGANQPFWSACGTRCIVFNGEIYNYVELRRELESAGVVFRTGSDTEVLLEAVGRWGEDALSRLNGMWTFVFIDLARGSALVSRDRWGVKPLHAVRRDGFLMLCSEAKGLLAYLGEAPKPNLSAIGLYMKFGVGGEHPDSWFEDVERFPPAQWTRLSIASGASPTSGKYWAYPSERSGSAGRSDVDRFEELLADAVRIRLRSDVPVGLSLSGGLDSATIAWLTGERCHTSLDAFTSWFRPVERSELPAAQGISSMFGHHSVPVPQADGAETLSLLADCIYFLDAGHSSTALVPYLNLCRAARSRVTVMLEGQGADELLAGYPEFALHAAADEVLAGRFGAGVADLGHFGAIRGWGRLPLDLLRSLSKSAHRHQAARWSAGSILGETCSAAAPSELLAISFGGDSLGRFLLDSHRGCLTNLLQYGDAISMSVNLETRCPFLDYRLVDFCFRLPTSQLYSAGVSKRILRLAASGHVPDSICWSRRKEGFTNPTIAELRRLGPGIARLHAAKDIACDLGIFRRDDRLASLLDGLPDNIFYRAVSVLLWCEIFFGPAPRWRSDRSGALA
jgi:asparagine synthase (glutamine-hydrolysing)